MDLVQGIVIFIAPILFCILIIDDSTFPYFYHTPSHMALCHITTSTNQNYSQAMVVKIVQLSTKFDGLYLAKEVRLIVHSETVFHNNTLSDVTLIHFVLKSLQCIILTAFMFVYF